MEIKKTINKVIEGELRIYDEITFNFKKRIVFVGAKIGDMSFPCEATFDEIFEGSSPEQKQESLKTFKKAHRIAINNKIKPDKDIQDEDIEIAL